ncbi:hypothetical protein [Polaromonas sp. CG_23.6]|uniref:hypothetical protein n=1 Tax=Polaromonas sp. CG_23.6 TaxID=2760709 RepID=UPI002473FFE2|nr:hypothetical protein [Polaromonas sp. CG_23.6]MDH6185487.1 hypothetical protein [Polaromonas sp. CG_23.6]
MELVEVEITGQAITARYGTLNTGDILRTDAEFAKHLVEDCAAAKYTTAKPVKQTKAIAPAAPVTRKRKAGATAAPAEGAAEPTTASPLLDDVPSTAKDDQGEANPVALLAANSATE